MQVRKGVVLLKNEHKQEVPTMRKFFELYKHTQHFSNFSGENKEKTKDL